MKIEQGKRYVTVRGEVVLVDEVAAGGHHRFDREYPVRGKLGPRRCSWTIEGRYHALIPHPNDLVGPA